MRTNHTSRVQILLMAMALALLLSQTTHVPRAVAGGPLIPGGSGFGTDGVPILWPSPSISYTTDGSAIPGGPALGPQTAAQADASVAGQLTVLQNIPSSNLTFTRTGGVSAASVPDGDVDTLAEFNALGCTGNPVIYDVDGSLTAARGQDPDTLLGSAGPCSFDASGAVLSGRAFLNGKLVASNPDLQLNATILHEFVHFLGGGHSQVNNNCLEAVVNMTTPCADGGDDSFGLPTMSPIAFGLEENVPGQPAELTPAEDDVGWLSRLYPDLPNFNAAYATISGTVFFSDGATPGQNVNVIARQVNDPVTPVDESRRCAFSVVSGYNFTAIPGQGITGDNPGSPAGSTNPGFIGTFDIPVRAVAGGQCSGATVGQYTLEVESVDPLFVGGSVVGPLGFFLSEQIPMPGTAPAPVGPIVVTAGGIFPSSNITLVGTPPANDSFDAVATNENPATATPVGDGTTTGSISPWRGSAPDIDVYAFTAIAGQTVTFDINARSAPYNDFLDAVVEVIDSGGMRQNLCDTVTAGVFTGACLNDDEVPGVVKDPVLSFQSGSSDTFYLRVFDWRGDARPDFVYDLVVTGAGQAPPPAGCTKDFDGGGVAPLSWADGANWNPDGVPGASDDVCIGAFSVQYDAGNTTIDTLTVAGTGTLNMVLTGSLTVTTSANVSGTLNASDGIISASDFTHWHADDEQRHGELQFRRFQRCRADI